MWLLTLSNRGHKLGFTNFLFINYTILYCWYYL